MMDDERRFAGLRARDDQAAAARDEVAARGDPYGRALLLATQVRRALTELQTIATGSDREAAELAGRLLLAIHAVDTDAN
jgi:hypothetical protein